MVGLTEVAICLAVLAIFVGYAVWKSVAVRVFGWVMLTAMTARVLAHEHLIVAVLAAVIALPIAVLAERRASRS